MFKRIFLFLLTNVAVIAVASIVLSVFGVTPYLTASGLDYQSLLIFATIYGFAGSFISLFISKWMAKTAFGVQIIQKPETNRERFVFESIESLAKDAGIGMPEVGIYDSPEPNAFATGWNKNNSLIAVSTGLLDSMTQEEVKAVLAHEISHASNGDMVTMALIQGVVNTFVIFFARIAAYAVSMFMSRGEEREGGMNMLVYSLVSIVFEIIFGILASIIVMYFSRYREFRADAGSAKLYGKENMILALKKLGSMQDQLIDDRGKAFSTMKIADKPSSIMQLFSSHPPIEDRIKALEQAN